MTPVTPFCPDFHTPKSGPPVQIFQCHQQPVTPFCPYNKPSNIRASWPWQLQTEAPVGDRPVTHKKIIDLGVKVEKWLEIDVEMLLRAKIKDSHRESRPLGLSTLRNGWKIGLRDGFKGSKISVAVKKYAKNQVSTLRFSSKISVDVNI